MGAVPSQSQKVQESHKMGAGECYWEVQDLPTTFQESSGINQDNGQKRSREGWQ